MNKIIKTIFVLIILFLNTWVFAESNINIELDKIDVNINDTFVVTVNIEITSIENTELSIKWLENFWFIWKEERVEESSSIWNNINWENYRKIVYKFFLKPNQLWKFIIWPAELKVWEEIINSNSFEININNDDSLFASPNKNSLSDDNNIESSNDKDDIKWIKNTTGMFYNFIYYQLLIILLLVFLYFYYLYINNKKKNKDLEMAEIKSAKDINKQLIKKIKILLKKIEELSKTEFYEKLNKIFREYFDIIWIKNNEMMTLKEIKELSLDENLIQLFEKSYMSEFNDKEDSKEKREEIINEFLKILK
jgi:hypothetical protein